MTENDALIIWLVLFAIAIAITVAYANYVGYNDLSLIGIVAVCIIFMMIFLSINCYYYKRPVNQNVQGKLVEKRDIPLKFAQF